jgi:hypothetical protein
VTKIVGCGERVIPADDAFGHCSYGCVGLGQAALGHRQSFGSDGERGPWIAEFVRLPAGDCSVGRCCYGYQLEVLSFCPKDKVGEKCERRSVPVSGYRETPAFATAVRPRWATPHPGND